MVTKHISTSIIYPDLQLCPHTAAGPAYDTRPENPLPAAGEGNHEVQTPPWRRVSAVIPSPPQHEYSTSRSVRQEENFHLYRQNNQQNDEGSRPPLYGDTDYRPSRYPDGYPDGAGVSDSEHRGEERTSREPEQVGEYGDQPYQPDRNVHWEGG